ncbi:hypothetical protein [Niastella populi]|uniref:Uncharacterized protein n=1 Tax=Niastella populi TaxID=550983 RepID=A0A1V9F2P5_9BACT|nr:hypothetical protein [Niastella populi]OQP52703.1 hypothetical protein A4R26_28535 [Niastella populi]
MSNPLFKKINIFLKVNEQTIDSYFNANDPAPIYKRQLSQEFEEYIMNYAPSIKRYSTVTYKLNCVNESDKEYLDPLVHAIRRHFSLKKSIREAEFKKFKKRNWVLLTFSLIVVMFFQGVMPLIFNVEHRIHSAFSNALDVFSWVILWKPIEKLIFYWNPFLKEISIFDKLINAPIIIVGEKKEVAPMEQEYAA